MARLVCVKLTIVFLRRPWLLACTLVVTPAWAQESAADLAMARELGTEGLRLAESGNCAAAVEKLSRAEKLHHAPTTLGRLGECEVALGRVVEGTEDLRRVAREHIPAHSAVFLAAQARARKALEEALPRIAKVRIDVAGPAASDVSLKIDGAPVSNAVIGVERPFDPGSHTIEATAEGYKTSSTQVQIAEGGSQTVTLTLVTEPNVVRHEQHTKPAVATTRNYVPAWIAFGLAGGAAIAGGIFGGVAIAKKNDLVAACGGTACSPAQRGAFDELSAFATASTVTFVIAGVAAIAGVVLVAAAPRRTVETVSLRVAPSGLWLGGTF